MFWSVHICLDIPGDLDPAMGSDKNIQYQKYTSEIQIEFHQKVQINSEQHERNTRFNLSTTSLSYGPANELRSDGLFGDCWWLFGDFW